MSIKAKKIWEKLRIQKNRLSAEEKSALVQELMAVVKEHDKMVRFVCELLTKVVVLNLWSNEPLGFEAVSRCSIKPSLKQ